MGGQKVNKKSDINTETTVFVSSFQLIVNIVFLFMRP